MSREKPNYSEKILPHW